MENKSEYGLNRKNIRWLYLGIFICQFILVVLLLLYSIRSVWDFVNSFLDDITGLKKNSFAIVYTVLIAFFILSVFVLIRFHKKAKKQNASLSTIAIVFLFFQLIVHVIILSQLYPNLVKLYLSQLPSWLFREGAAYVILVMVVVSSGLLWSRNRSRNDQLLQVLILLNGLLLSVVLSFAYISITVRHPQFSQRILNTLPGESDQVFHIDIGNAEADSSDSTRMLYPDLSLQLDMEKGGNYLDAGDLTGDGIVEIITLKAWVEPPDLQRVKSVAVQSILPDSASGSRGKTIWSWESDSRTPDNIGGGRGSSVAVAVFDLETGKENRKLLLATDGWLYEFTFHDNGTVSEKKVAAGSLAASDCMIIANLDGSGRHHLLLKDAYHTIWAYDKDLNLIWKTKKPHGFLLAHRIGAYDLNDDGIDEILAGACILNANGEVINNLRTNSVKLWYGGHIDGIVPIRQDDKWYISVTYCDGLGFALFDSEGNLEWEVTGSHFEYLIGGYFFNTPELRDQFQLMSKIHYDERNPQVMMNQDGRFLGLFAPGSASFPVDWTGDGYHEMVFSSPASVYSGTRKIADLYVPGREDGAAFTMRISDVTGRTGSIPDGIPDILVRASDENDQHFLHIYKNLKGKKPTNYVYPGIGWESSANYFTKYFEYKRSVRE